MTPLLAIVLLGTLLAVNSERHSLSYIYTAVSKPSGIQGIHEFTAMGLLDGRMIDYYDSTTQTKVPRQPWIKRLKPADYWSKGSESRKSKHEWFKINIDILLKRTRENDTDSHILQWLHGCEGEMHPGSKMTLAQVMDRYSWDGQDFLSFDDATDVWVASSNVAQPTKAKWDGVRVLKEYTKGYLEKECLDFLEEFVNCEQDNRVSASPPEVYTYKRNAKVEANTILVCMATSFISEDTVVQIKQDGRILTRQDGLTTGEVLPNEDETFQRTVHVEILKSDKSIYTCEVFDVATKHSLKKVWEDEPTGTSMGLIGGGVGVVVVLILAVVVGVFLVKRMKKSVQKPSPNGSVSSSVGVQATSIPLRKSSNESIPSQDSGVSSTKEAPEMQGLMTGEQQ
ncbi:major histocompatibility complex class I-related protein 1-like isoform X2 [Nelusetta ayraudi]|uniref:major histocompatibility complex class I-related protein 1-like isoform X2 n=1 Tax=Nelusetta ayraudi TaxID=303726 RepID=UPI003F73004A